MTNSRHYVCLQTEKRERKTRDAQFDDVPNNDVEKKQNVTQYTTYSSNDKQKTALQLTKSYAITLCSNGWVRRDN